MSSHTHYLWFNTRQRQEIIDITDRVSEHVGISGLREGMVGWSTRSRRADHGGQTGSGPLAAVLYGEWDGQRRTRGIMKVLGEP